MKKYKMEVVEVLKRVVEVEVVDYHEWIHIKKP